MADIDRDFPERTRVERDRVYATNTGGGAGWWIAGVLILAVLIIGFIAMSGGNPAPVESTAPAVEAPVAPVEPAPMVETAPMTPVDPAPATPAPAPAETAPAPAPVTPAPVN